MRKIIGLLLVTLTSAFPSGAVWAGAYDDGVKAYTSKNYQQACDKFESAIRESPGNSNAYYYDALCWHQLRRWSVAAQRYREVIQRFPNSSAAAQARFNLSSLSVASPKASSSADNNSCASTVTRYPSASGSARDEDDERGSARLVSNANTTKLYYRSPEDSGTAFIVNAQVNGRPIEMLFDTGASIIALGKNHLSQLGLPPISANQRPDGMSAGVGSVNGNAIWRINADLKLGDFVIKDCPMYVQEHLSGEPLLGQTAFKFFNYTIDYGAKAIQLARRDRKVASAPSGPAGSYSVPFTREGNELVVDSVINGRPYKCYFDTGAMSCAFTMKDMSNLGLEIPSDASVRNFGGVSGSTRGYVFPIRSMKVGPIEKHDFEISVVQNAAMSKPLLGQTFYEGWQYTVDNDANLIRFVRR